MIRYLSAILVAGSVSLMIGQAQEIVPANHGTHAAKTVVVDGGSCASCATGTCGTCNDCTRITEIRKTQHPVYSCKVKEICVPSCSLFGLFCRSGNCQKIEVRQLVKKYRTDEECVNKCATAEEAAKHYEAEAKRAAERAPVVIPAPTPGKLPAGAVGHSERPIIVPMASSFARPAAIPAALPRE